MTCWCKLSLMRGVNTRAMTSKAPPAANGTTMVTGRVGHSCARAGAAHCRLAASATTTEHSHFILILPLDASLRLEESRIERERRDLRNLDRDGGCEPVIDK